MGLAAVIIGTARRRGHDRKPFEVLKASTLRLMQAYATRRPSAGKGAVSVGCSRASGKSLSQFLSLEPLSLPVSGI